MDYGLLIAWIPKLFVIAAVVSLIFRLIMRNPIICIMGGALIPIAYEFIEAVDVNRYGSAASPGSFQDMLIISFAGLLGTLPGGLLGYLMGRAICYTFKQSRKIKGD